jgi:hypothetical protein
LVEALPKSGTFTYGVNAFPAVLKLRAHAMNSTSVKFQADDMRGLVSNGYKSLTFKGSNYEGMLNLRFRHHFGGPSRRGELELGADFVRWEGVQVLDIPYFDDILGIYSALAEDWIVDLRLYLQGKMVVGGHANIDRNNEVLLQAYNLLKYTESARVISQLLQVPISLRLGNSISAEQHLSVAELAQVLAGKKTYAASQLAEPPTCDIVMTESKYLETLAGTEPATLLVVYSDSTIEVFGQEIELPPAFIEVQNARLRFEDVKTSESGDINARCVFDPQDGFKVVYGYQLGSRELPEPS